MPLNNRGGEEMCVELDARCAIDVQSLAWTPERREQFLVRLDVARPLSIDVRVWPKASETDGTRVAFSILRRGMSRESQAMWLPRAFTIEGETERLGYDVADEVMTSGLSNCGYSNEERDVVRLCWASRLNRFHLFDDGDEALQFKDFSDARVPEHAPFFVFGIYRLAPAGAVTE